MTSEANAPTTVSPDDLVLVLVPSKGRTATDAALGGKWFVAQRSGLRVLAEAGFSIEQARVALGAYRAKLTELRARWPENNAPDSRADALRAAHSVAAGALCADVDGDLCCDACGVSLSQTCELCGGVGYHRTSCTEFEA